MLTADLVRVQRRGTRLTVTSLSTKSRPRAEQLAQVYLQTAIDHVGLTFGQLQEAWDAVEVGPREVKLAAGLRKLVEDACEFDEQVPVEPRSLRSDVFLLAAQERRRDAANFEREQVISQIAQRHALEPAVLDAALFADLRSEHRLTRHSALTADALLQRYDLAQYQAVLLRAVHVTAHVVCRSPVQYRALFHALKFRRLLHVIRRDGDGYCIEIDGPFSLFESVTKYGLQLALLFPVLRACDKLKLVADLRWGKTRQALSFEYEHSGSNGLEAEAVLTTEVEQLMESFAKLSTPWRVRVNDELLELPGVGLCVPDLVFERGGKKTFMEVMGYWSRNAVWKRVELVQAGLAQRILFAASSRLRVSEEVLEDAEHASLYVYKGTLSAKVVLGHLDRLNRGEA